MSVAEGDVKDPTQRRVRLTVVATESPEPMDIDTWAARYVRLAIAAYLEQRHAELRVEQDASVALADRAQRDLP